MEHRLLGACLQYGNKNCHYQSHGTELQESEELGSASIVSLDGDARKRQQTPLDLLFALIVANRRKNSLPWTSSRFYKSHRGFFLLFST